MENGRLLLPSPLSFAAGSATPDTAAEPTLQAVVEFLTSKSYITTLRIEGHVPDNQALSEQRAMATARWLVAHGIACERLLPVGFGGSKPVADGSTPEGRAANSRIEMSPAALRGLPIGGMPLDGGGKVAGDPCKP